MAQLSNDCFAFGGQLMSAGEALAILKSKVHAVTEVEAVGLSDGRGRILAAPVVATRDVPPHDNAAVDGYAVNFDDLKPGESTVLPIGGRAAAGHPLGRPVARGESIRIFTGAQMPADADTVLMQEDCRVVDGKVTLPPGIKRGANRRFAGEDVKCGATVLAAGRRLRPQEIGLAASLGLTTLTVRRKLRVAIFSTGDEV
ncbi:MAG TPA: molybdopterin molybdotransferase MoeA, partial [Stellaceae bacterium]|nr:molybdopterin molybdotransferase MoeA [Stellaceae bacterium]